MSLINIAGKYLVPRNVFSIAALIVVLYSTFLAIGFSDQPPLDAYSFRQTQTALTSYWFTQDGFKLAYQTPVAGAPWILPFEFPLYQIIVAMVSKISGLSLDVIGRVTSYAFLVLCLVPIRSITRKLELPHFNLIFLCFVILLFSSPIYVYWGRTFMIETAALFFSIMAIKYFLDLLLENRFPKTFFLFSFFGTLSILQKSTTIIPVLAVLAIVFVCYELRQQKSNKYLFRKSNLILVAVGFVLPVFIGALWVNFIDRAKLSSPLGAQLASSALNAWNWGTIAQRASSEIWVKVVWNRILFPNIGGVLGVVLLLMPLCFRMPARIRNIVISSLVLGIAPLFIFTNLHLVHEYYQTANVIFLIFGVSVVLGGFLLPMIGPGATMLMIAAIATSNYVALCQNYLPQIKQVFNKTNRDLVVGEVLKHELPLGSQFVAFGNDWNSSFAYLAQRKSFTVPPWFTSYKDVIANPEKYVDANRLGGLVSCSVESPSFGEFMHWVSTKKSWKIGETTGCLIAVPEKTVILPPYSPMPCDANIDKISVETRNGVKIISINGWIVPTDNSIPNNDHAFLKISDGKGDINYLEVLRVPRMDVTVARGVPVEIDVGFSRIIPNDLAAGEYDVGLLQYSDKKFQVCAMKNKMVIGN
jgi:hypothetical protein